MAIRTSSPSSSTGYLTLIRENTNFRWLWIGQIISLLGDWFNLIASAALIAMLTNSGLAVGGLFAIRFLAQFVGSPIGGVLADRLNRKHLLIFTDLTRALTVLGFLLVRNPGDIWLLYTLTAVQMALAGIFFPTRNAILPDVVNQSELGAANALSSATWSTMLAFGAALGGLVAGEWGLAPAFVIDSATFLLSAFFIARVSYSKTILVDDQQRRWLDIFSGYAEGIRYLSSRRDVSILALQKASQAIGVTSAFQILQVALSSQVYVIGEGGSTSLGLFYAVVGIGTGIGPIAARWITGDDEKRLRWAIFTGYIISAAGLLIMSTLVNFPLVLFGTLLRGLGVALGWVFSTQLLLQIVPNRVRGRVFSTEFAVLTLAQAAGASLGGWIFDGLGASIPQMLIGMTGITLLFGAVWAVSGLLRLSPTDQPDKLYLGESNER